MSKRVVFSSDNVVRARRGHYVVFNNKVTSNYGKIFESQDALKHKDLAHREFYEKYIDDGLAGVVL